MVANHRTFDIAIDIIVFRFGNTVFIIFLDNPFAAIVHVIGFALYVTVFVVFLFGAFLLVFDIGCLDTDFSTGVIFNAYVFARTKNHGRSEYARKNHRTHHVI